MNQQELPFPDINQLLAQFKLPGVDVNALIEGRRKDIEAVAAANRHAYEGMQLLAQRQAEMLREAIAEWQQAASQAMSSQGASAISLQEPTAFSSSTTTSTLRCSQAPTASTSGPTT